jgi:AAA family ATPase
MTLDISLDGPKRSFVVESFMDGANILHRSIARFADGSIVKVKDESSPKPEEIQEGPYSDLRIASVAGLEPAVERLNSFFATFSHSNHTVIRTWRRRPCGMLLNGPRGVGKSLVIEMIAKTGWGKVFYINPRMKVSEIRDIFNDCQQFQRSIIVVDDIDSLFVKEHGQSSNFESTLGEEMDRLNIGDAPKGKTASKVLVLAATSSLGDIPSTLRKRGRFTKVFPLPLPDADARKRILKSLAPTLTSDAQLSVLDRLGERTHAYTGEDLALLLDEVGEIGEQKDLEPGIYDDSVKRLEEDIDQALLVVRPSAMHDITLQPPKVRWDEIGGQESVKKTLRRAVETPLLVYALTRICSASANDFQYPDFMKRLGVPPKKGILLYGPPGCSKTLSAQAMATEAGFNFFAVKGAELLNMYVGESERAVREIFARARAASPSIIFFDEIESIGSKRESGGRNNGINVLTTLLNEMDGIETLKGVTVLAATNKPEALDLALIRPGRFDDLLYVAPPDHAGREEILRVRQRGMDWADDVDIPELARLTDGYSGAEIVKICAAAGERVMNKGVDTGDFTLKVHMDDFVNAMQQVKRQITPELIAGYQNWAAGRRNGLSW